MKNKDSLKSSKIGLRLEDSFKKVLLDVQKLYFPSVSLSNYILYMVSVGLSKYFEENKDSISKSDKHFLYLFDYAKNREMKFFRDIIGFNRNEVLSKMLSVQRIKKNVFKLIWNKRNKEDCMQFLRLCSKEIEFYNENEKEKKELLNFCNTFDISFEIIQRNILLYKEHHKEFTLKEIETFTPSKK